MRLLEKLRRGLAEPVRAGYVAWSHLNPPSLRHVYRAQAQRAGIDRLYLIVSFDCDTEQDMAVAWDVHRRVRECGVLPAYAVPGELLAEGAAIYRRIAETGAEFLNHGHRRHTYFDAALGEHRSCFFYDQQALDVVKADVIGGDRAVRQVLDLAPRGFRTPHFGTFQRPAQLRFLHGLLRELGYGFSTSTPPYFAFRYGPVFDTFGLREIPVSGGASRPLTILDTWVCFRAPDRVLTPEDYRTEALGLAQDLAGGPGILNYYADPSHIADQPIFFETIAALARLAQPTTYRDLMERVT